MTADAAAQQPQSIGNSKFDIPIYYNIGYIQVR